MYGEKKNADRVLVGKPTRKRPLGRTRCRWENNTTCIIKRWVERV
jgi:hypothetical protein